MRATVRQDRVGLSDNWLRHVQDVRERHQAKLTPLYHESHQVDRLCELNVVEQVRNVCQTTIVRDAWDRGQPLAVHGWIYGLKDGLLRDLAVTATDPRESELAYGKAVEALS